MWELPSGATWEGHAKATGLAFGSGSATPTPAKIGGACLTRPSRSV